MSNPWADLSRPPLREAALREALTSGPTPDWRSLDVVAVTGSTNADLAGRARSGEAGGAVLVADHQSAGRGRRDRTWQSPPRAGLAVSLLLRPSAPLEHWSWLTLMAATAVTDVLIRTCGLPATLKWPNDVLVPVPDDAGRPHKVAGLLAEVVRTETAAGTTAVVLGIGVNISHDEDELPVPTATSLKLAGSATVDRDTVLRALLRALAARYRDYESANGDPRAGLAAVYRERCSTIGQQVRVELPDGSTFEGLADGVDDGGRLAVLDQRPGGGSHLFSAGDVVHIRPAEPA